MKTQLHHISHWLGRHWKLLTAISLAGIIVAAGSVAAVHLHQPGVVGTERVTRDTSTREEKPIPRKKPIPLTGEKVDPDSAQRPVTGVMIENSLGARPQTGLDAADAVFEAVVEGGITRYLVLYQSNAPGKIGPVRSLRPYFLDWVMGFDAPIAHVGGSARALKLVKQRGAKDLDQFKHGRPYYRGGGRPSPHNMYSSVKDLRSLQKRLGYATSQFKPIPRSDDNPADKPKAKKIAVNYSSSQYRAQFRYQKNGNRYRRFLAGSPHVDTATGRPITVKNVVVVRMPTSKRGRYAVMDTIGNGTAFVFKNGKVVKGKWRQRSVNDRIEVLNSRGNHVKLNRGDTWFAILPSGQPFSY